MGRFSAQVASHVVPCVSTGRILPGEPLPSGPIPASTPLGKGSTQGSGQALCLPRTLPAAAAMALAWLGSLWHQAGRHWRTRQALQQRAMCKATQAWSLMPLPGSLLCLSPRQARVPGGGAGNAGKLSAGVASRFLLPPGSKARGCHVLCMKQLQH